MNSKARKNKNSTKCIILTTWQQSQISQKLIPYQLTKTEAKYCFGMLQQSARSQVRERAVSTRLRYSRIIGCMHKAGLRHKKTTS